MFNVDSFISSNYGSVLAFIKGTGLNTQDAEDTTQNVFLEFIKKQNSGRINHNDNTKAYLFKIARWRLVDRMRHNNHHSANLLQVGEENNLDELPSEKVDNSWKKSLLKRAAKQIKGKVNRQYYNLFCSQVFDGLRAEDAAQKHGSSVPTAHLAKHRAGKEVIAAAKEILKYGI